MFIVNKKIFQFFNKCIKNNIVYSYSKKKLSIFKLIKKITVIT